QLELAIQDAVDAEAGRQDADDRARRAVDDNAAADGGRIGAELTPPEPVAEQHDVVVSRPAVGLDEAASERRLDAEKREKCGFDAKTFDAYGSVETREVVVDRAIRRRDLER